MNNIDWSKAPEGADTYEIFMGELQAYCKEGGYFDSSGVWVNKKYPHRWQTIATRPTTPQVGQIIDHKDMVEGMVVKCVESINGGWYEANRKYAVGTDGYGDFGPLDEGGNASSNPQHYKFTLVSMPEQRKTVEDAVEYLSDVGDGEWDSDLDALCYHKELWHYMENGESQHQVCTREEFEACAKKKEAYSLKVNYGTNVPIEPVGKSEPEWTHVTHLGGKCKVIHTYSGKSWVFTEGGVDKVMMASNLKPIKPTITKAQAEEQLGVTITD